MTNSNIFSSKYDKLGAIFTPRKPFNESHDLFFCHHGVKFFQKKKNINILVAQFGRSL
jgi:hypothetical protein